MLSLLHTAKKTREISYIGQRTGIYNCYAYGLTVGGKQFRANQSSRDPTNSYTIKRNHVTTLSTSNLHRQKLHKQIIL